jgi:hypothetical protein
MASGGAIHLLQRERLPPLSRLEVLLDRGELFSLERCCLARIWKLALKLLESRQTFLLLLAFAGIRLGPVLIGAVNGLEKGVDLLGGLPALELVTGRPDAIIRLFSRLGSKPQHCFNSFTMIAFLATLTTPIKDIETSCIHWDFGTVDMTADEAVAASQAQVTAPTLEEAKDLVASLSGKNVKEIENAGKDAGISWSTMRRAKDKLGFKATKDGMKGGWLWRKD